MHEVTLKARSNEELKLLLDKKLDHIFIHKFNPNEHMEWWQTSISTKNGILLDDLLVRDMQFDLQTNLERLEQIIDLNTNQLRIYQFSKLIAPALFIDHLPEMQRDNILQQNGLHHVFFIDFEFVTVRSFDPEFIRSIETNPIFENRIMRKTL